MKVTFNDIPRTGKTRAVLILGGHKFAAQTCMRRDGNPDADHVYSSISAAKKHHPDVEIPTTMPEYPDAVRLPRVGVIVSDMDPDILRERVRDAYFDDDVVAWCAEKTVQRRLEIAESRKD